MRFDRFAAIMLFVAVTLAGSLVAAPAEAAPKDGQKFGDWVARCAKEKPSECVLVQTQVVDGGARLLEITLGKVGTKGEFGAVAIVPLGVYLPAGVAILIDDKQHAMTLMKCLQNGCQAVMPLDSAMIEALRKSKTVVVGMIREEGRQTISIPVPATGLADGLAALK